MPSCRNGQAVAEQRLVDRDLLEALLVHEVELLALLVEELVLLLVEAHALDRLDRAEALVELGAVDQVLELDLLVGRPLAGLDVLGPDHAPQPVLVLEHVARADLVGADLHDLDPKLRNAAAPALSAPAIVAHEWPRTPARRRRPGGCQTSSRTPMKSAPARAAAPQPAASNAPSARHGSTNSSFHQATSSTSGGRGGAVRPRRTRYSRRRRRRQASRRGASGRRTRPRIRSGPSARAGRAHPGRVARDGRRRRRSRKRQVDVVLDQERDAKPAQICRSSGASCAILRPSLAPGAAEMRRRRPPRAPPRAPARSAPGRAPAG